MSDTVAHSAQRVSVTLDGGVADVRMNRPEKRNALDPAMFAALVAAGERLKTEPGVRVVVLSGEGPDFCAGLDFGFLPGDAVGRPGFLGRAAPALGRARPRWLASGRPTSGPSFRFR